MLGKAFDVLPIAVAYAIWTGATIIGLTTFNTLWLREAIGGKEILFIALIIVGIVGLQFASHNH